jgi:ankyrin repeat protein
LLRLLAVLAISFGLASAAATDAVLIKTFHHAVQIGNTSTVRTMLSADPTLARSSDQYRFQPIHLLDMYFSEEILDLLLADGADINARNDEGVTLLHIVTDPDAVAVLVRKGADIEVRDKRGWTPLIMQASE